MNGAEVKRLSRLVFLGTGTSQGVPIIGCHCEVCASMDSKDERLRASVVLESESSRVVIDTGPDFRIQMLREALCLGAERRQDRTPAAPGNRVCRCFSASIGKPRQGFGSYVAKKRGPVAGASWIRNRSRSLYDIERRLPPEVNSG